MREIIRALAEPGFGEDDEELPGWEGRRGVGPVERYATLTEYEEDWPYPVAFAPERPPMTLAGVIAAAGARQLHVAETEKYPHVTYFFNGGEERPYAGERRELVPSPRDVPTYDHKPEMSARRGADRSWRPGASRRPRFAIINFANPDMVGHTGVIPAAVRAVETVDECLGEVVAAVHAAGGACVVTADHGNAEHMLEPDGSPNTAHSLNPVPLIVTVARRASCPARGHPRRRRADRARAARRPPARGDDRALADREPRGGAMTGRTTRAQRLIGLFFVGAGVNHFALPGPYRQIVPPRLRRSGALVALSGVAEIAGGVGVLLPAPPPRRVSGCSRCWSRSSPRTCTWRASRRASGGFRAGRCTRDCRCSR